MTVEQLIQVRLHVQYQTQHRVFGLFPHRTPLRCHLQHVLNYATLFKGGVKTRNVGRVCFSSDRNVMYTACCCFCDTSSNVFQ